MTSIQGMAEESELLFSSKKERLEMLEKVLKASDADADEEADFGGAFDSQQVSVVTHVPSRTCTHTHTHPTPPTHTHSPAVVCLSTASLAQWPPCQGEMI